MTAPFIFAAQIIDACIYEPDAVMSRGRNEVFSITVRKHEPLRQWAEANSLPLFICRKTGHYVLMNYERPEITFGNATPGERAAAFHTLGYSVHDKAAAKPDKIFMEHPVTIKVAAMPRISKTRRQVVYPSVVGLEVDLSLFLSTRRQNQMSAEPSWPTVAPSQFPDVMTEMKNRIHDVYHDTWDLIEALDELGECPHPKVRAAIEAARVSADNIAHLVPED